MLMSNPWPGAVGRFLLWTVGAALIGLVSGYFWPVMALAALAGLLVNVYQLHRLEYWLRRTRKPRPPRTNGLWGAVFDGLERQQLRHRSRRQRLSSLLREFRETANAMPDGAIVLNNNAQMLWWNRIAGRYLPLKWPQDQGQRINNLLRHPDFLSYFAKGDWQAAVKIPAPHDDRRMLEIRVVPYGADQQLLLARDITALHRLETMRRDFVGNISHELRTPLTVVRGMSEQLSDLQAPGPDDLKRPLALIEQQVERMTRLVDDLLLLSRLENEAPAQVHQPIDVAHLLTALREEARTLSAGDHEITVRVDAPLPLRGDEGELRSAFSNLLTNAIKYTPAGGRVDVRWFAVAGAQCLSVADTGRGIAPQHLPRLTERFYRVDSGRSSRDGGTGLGLAIVKHILARHDARLEITSEVGVGSTFTCVFPHDRAR